MNSERWERVQQLLEEALQRSEPERRSYLQAACADDPGLMGEVVSLLEASPAEEMPTSWVRAVAKPEPPRFVAGDRIAGRYRIECLLGRGGTGEVYEAHDEELGITVALKTLRLTGIESEGLRRLRLEGILARAVWHPNVCRVYDLDVDENDGIATWFLTMERLHGTTLAEQLRVLGKLSPDRSTRLAIQMAAALGAAHAAGVVHRDFKPANVILVNREGAEWAVVTDFGTARAAARTDSQSDETAIPGTPAYMAPEQVRGEEVSPAADIYALGVVLYEMVTGQLPFFGGSLLEVARQRLEQEAPTPRSLMPELEERLDAIIRRCLEREPEHRFARAEEVADALAGRMTLASKKTAAPHSRIRSTLPAERDPFVGRESEIEELDRALAQGAGIVTLVGAGGMGKTRLALHYGWTSLGVWPGGVWFCDLADARSVNGILTAVAGALGTPIGRGNPIQQLGNVIAARGECLFILDNFEQVAAYAAETIGRWQELAKEAHWIATSRERLSLERERVLTLEALPIEQGVELFEKRAQGLLPALELAGTEAEAAREIVELIEGMPLAIELAAARTRVMSVVQIAAQMRKRFQLLTGGTSTRHETLQGVIEGSWDLLKPWEQAAWAQCSVFDGGFTLEAAEAVLDLGAWPNAPSAMDIVRSLTDKSLLRAWVPVSRPGEEPAEPRFGMYVSLREYAGLQLQDAGATERRHGKWFARHGTDEAIEALSRHGGTVRRQRLGRELGNLTAACRRALERGEGAMSAAAYRAAAEVVLLRGPYGTAVQLGTDLLAGSALEPKDEANVLLALGAVERLSGRMDEADSHCKAAIEVVRRCGERGIEGAALSFAGVLCAERSRRDEARAHFEAALAIYEQLGREPLVGVLTGYLGSLSMDQGRMEEARPRMERALSIHRTVGNRRFEGQILGNLAILHREQGRLEEALRHIDQARAIHRETGDRRLEGVMLGQMGNVHVDQGQLEEAQKCYEAALAIFREIGARPIEAQYLANLGIIFRQMDRKSESQAYLETALAIHREVGDRSAEGIALDNLGGMLREQGRLEEAREALSKAESIFRQIGARTELAMLLCTVSALEREVGATAKARAALEEARAIADEVGVGPGSELGRMLAKTVDGFGAREGVTRAPSRARRGNSRPG